MTERRLRRIVAATALSVALVAGASCSGSGTDGGTQGEGAAAHRLLSLTVTGPHGSHVFQIERARTAAEQERGLMYRTAIPADGGMLFWPYPPQGGPARIANFWMKNTPSPLDILFIRANGTIAHIAENAVPFDETVVSSGEPVSAVLELRGGRASDLGIAEGDKVTWQR